MKENFLNSISNFGKSNIHLIRKDFREEKRMESESMKGSFFLYQVPLEAVSIVSLTFLTVSQCGLRFEINKNQIKGSKLVWWCFGDNIS